MKNFIKIITICIIIILSITAKSIENKIIFKINDKIFTTEDLKNRQNYLFIENRITSEITALDDLILSDVQEICNDDKFFIF